MLMIFDGVRGFGGRRARCGWGWVEGADRNRDSGSQEGQMVGAGGGWKGRSSRLG